MEKPTEIKNARVTSAVVRLDRGWIVSPWLMLDGGGWGCGFGGYHCGSNTTEDNMKPQAALCAEFIQRCMAICEAEEFHECAGSVIRVKTEGLGGGIVAIGHPLKDTWFSPRDEWDREKQTQKHEDQ